jgi:hypothetical protein
MIGSFQFMFVGSIRSLFFFFFYLVVVFGRGWRLTGRRRGFSTPSGHGGGWVGGWVL